MLKITVCWFATTALASFIYYFLSCFVAILENGKTISRFVSLWTLAMPSLSFFLSLLLTETLTKAWLAVLKYKHIGNMRRFCLTVELFVLSLSSGSFITGIQKYTETTNTPVDADQSKGLARQLVLQEFFLFCQMLNCLSDRLFQIKVPLPLFLAYCTQIRILRNPIRKKKDHLCLLNKQEDIELSVCYIKVLTTLYQCLLAQKICVKH